MGLGKLCNPTSGVCVACYNDGHCNLNEYCDSTGTCVAKVCPTTPCNSNEICDTTTYTCRTCNNDTECSNDYPARPYCKKSAADCWECRKDGHCTSGNLLFCNTGTGICEACSSDAQCGLNKKCVTNVCSDCQVSSDCNDPDKPFCKSNNCTGCTEDSDCYPQFCNNGTGKC